MNRTIALLALLAALTGLAACPARAAPPVATPTVQQVAAKPTSAEVVTDGFTLVQNGTYRSPAPPKPPRRWKVPAETSLRGVLDAWSRAEGWELYWPAEDRSSEWQTEVEVNFEAATFEEAVTRFIEGLPSKVGIVARFNRANSPKLLYVSESTLQQEIRK